MVDTWCQATSRQGTKIHARIKPGEANVNQAQADAAAPTHTQLQLLIDGETGPGR